ncbi:MAG TPA: 8-oxo-dGTP diphosphatase MutT [Woeseiaceae bacterium]|nr:8-oxo-dGTP diphosphatase MutT [Woeseiaceae bacterium]
MPRKAVVGSRLRVVAGILIDSEGCVLLAERVHDHPFAGLWEFPGGKIDAAETPIEALRRELFEELSVEIVAFERFLTVEHDYADRRVEIDFFRVTEWRNEPRPLLNQRLRWVHMDALVADELLPANVAVVEALHRAM